MYSLLFIQIQHLLKLNIDVPEVIEDWGGIQIQHLLKLNNICKYKRYREKQIQIQHLLKLNWTYVRIWIY